MHNPHMTLTKITFIILMIIMSACTNDSQQLSAKDHLDLAHLYYNQGSFKATIIEGKNALQLEPDNLEAFTTIAKAYIKLSNGENASNIIKKAMSIDESDDNLKLVLTKAYLLQGKSISARTVFDSINITLINDISTYQSVNADLFLSSNNPKEAKIWYLKSHKSNSKNVEAMLGAAKASLLLQQPEDVERYTALAIKTFPKEVDVLLWQARIYILHEKYAAAEDVLSKAMIELEDNETLTVNKYAAIDMLAKVLIAQGKIEESLTYSNYLAQSQPGQMQASYKQALTLVSKGGDLYDAEKAFQELLKQAPRHKPSGTILGLINYAKGDFKQADDYLSKFANDENTPLRSKKILALTKIKLNKLDDAISIVSESIKHHQNDADLHAMLGFIYLKQRNPSKSIVELKRAIELDKSNSIHYINLARAFLLQKEPDHAINAAHHAYKLNPTSEQVRATLASSYIVAKKIDNAKNIINAWLKDSPNSIQALNLSASLEQKTGSIDNARSQFLKALVLEPYNLTANMNIISFDLKENKLNEAFKRLKLIINKYPENSQALNILYNIAIKTQMSDDIIKALNKANIQNPLAINSRLTLAQLYLVKNNPVKTLSIVDEINKLENKNTTAYLLKAKAYAKQNNIENAKKTYLLLASLDQKNPISYTELSQLHIQQKDFTLAIEYADKAIKIQDNFIPAHFLRATAYIEINLKEKAFQSINILKKQIPNSHIPSELEADYYIKNTDHRSAIKQLELAWSKQQNTQLADKLMHAYQATKQDNIAFKAWDELANKNKKNLKLQISYSIALHSAGQLSKTQDVLESLLQSFPKNPVLLNNLANLYLDRNDKRALETAKTALSLSPENPSILDTVGWIYTLQHKNYTEGVAILEKAYRASSDEQIKQHLIKALSDSGRVAEADKLSK